jgi:hypothetical protein
VERSVLRAFHCVVVMKVIMATTHRATARPTSRRPS